MNGIEIRPMRSRAEMRRFHMFPGRIYAGDPLWIPPLLPDRMKATDPRHGLFFRHGRAEFFAAYREGRMAGTIGLAVDENTLRELGRKEAVFGFFECINDFTVADALFAHADQWAAERGLSSLHGPFNLDYEDGYGLLTDGRDRKPVIFCGHTPEYYLDLFGLLGFEPARAGNIALAVDLVHPPPQLERLRRPADLARRQEHFVIRSADVRRWRDEAVHVHHLLNNSLSESGDEPVPWPMEAVEALIRPVLKIADPDLVLFAEKRGGDGTAVGWFAAVPNMNEVIEHLNGLRYPWDYLRIPFAMRRRIRCLAVKSLLVLPQYHRTGVAPLLFDEMTRRAVARGYEWMDLSLTSEANPETPVLAERSGAVRYKRYQVYRRAVTASTAVLKNVPNGGGTAAGAG